MLSPLQKVARFQLNSNLIKRKTLVTVTGIDGSLHYVLLMHYNNPGALTLTERQMAARLPRNGRHATLGKANEIVRVPAPACLRASGPEALRLPKSDETSSNRPNLPPCSAFSSIWQEISRLEENQGAD
jgi:hypothetical protein